jgi:hypothetical protein
MKKRIVTLIPPDEELTIRLLIVSQNDLQVRLGLIRLCECYQKGLRLKNPQDIRDKLRSVIFDKHFPEQARWALKIIAEMRNPEDHDILRARLKEPPDQPAYYAENLAWTVVAFHAVSNEQQIHDAYERGVINRDSVALIAHELAEIDGLLPSDLPRINIQKADDVLLKCACVCMATSRNKRGVFDPKFKQEEQLVALNQHHAAEVSQYSIYAMFRLPRLQFKDLGFRLDQLPGKPLEVRRWAYRLLSKQQSSLVKNQDLFEEIIRTDRDGGALEGLALGLREMWYDGIERPIVDWYQSQYEERVQVALLEHMARQSDRSSSYSDFVIDRYRNGATSLLQARLKEAATTTALYGKLQVLDDELVNRQGSLFVNVSDGGTFNMAKNTQIFTGGNVNIGVNTVGGNSISNKVDQEIELSQDMRALTLRLQKIADSNKNSIEGKAASEALANLTKSPSQKSLTTALETVRKWLGAGALVAEAASLAKDFVDAASNLLS